MNDWPTSSSSDASARNPTDRRSKPTRRIGPASHRQAASAGPPPAPSRVRRQPSATRSSRHHHVAVGDVEHLVAGGGRRRRPSDRPRHEVGADDPLTDGAPPGKSQGLPRFPQDGRPVGPDRRDHVHVAAERLAQDHLRPEDRPRPIALLLPGEEMVLLEEVEVLVRMTRRAFARGLSWSDVGAVGLVVQVGG